MLFESIVDGQMLRDTGHPTNTIAHLEPTAQVKSIRFLSMMLI